MGLPLYINNGFGKIKKLIISATNIRGILKDTFEWNSMSLEEFIYEGVDPIYLYLTSSFKQKELVFSSNVTLNITNIVFDKITFNNDLFCDQGIGSFKSKVVEFKKELLYDGFIDFGKSTNIYSSYIIIGRKKLNKDAFNNKSCFYPLDENGLTIYSYRETNSFKEQVFELCSVLPNFIKIDE